MSILINLPLKIAVAIGLALVAQAVLPAVEGRLLPVNGPLVITEIEPSPTDGWSIVSGDLQKLRGCAFEALTFSLIQYGSEAVAGYRFLEHTRVRTVGGTAFGPWEVQLTPDQIDNVKMTARHRCHAFFKTETSVPVVLAAGKP